MFASPRDSEVLVLDPRIRDYVLLPILIVMFMQGILRNNIAKLLRSPPAVPSREKLLKAQPLIRSKQLRATGGFVSSEAFQRRKAELLENSLVPEQVEEKKDGGDEIPAPDMEQLNSTMNMMKGNMAGFIPQMLSMGWVSYFFSGFVVIKMPFPLTDAFKPMLQRGIALSSLDPSYVSSLSWYFLNLFGLQGLFSIFLGGDNAADDTKVLQLQAGAASMMTAGAAPSLGGMKPDPNKPILQERDELTIFDHKFQVKLAEYRILNEQPPSDLL